MARIPDAELEQLKRDTDLVALVQAAGVELRRHGANLVGRCPFHDDQGPSLVITPAKNLWHCLGACQAGGTVIDWVMRTERVSFRHAVEWLRARAGSAPVHALAPIAAMAQEAASLEDTALVRDVLDFYHETLTTSPEAIAYLERRALNAVALIDHFQLGYANRTLGYRLQGSRWKAGATLRGRLQSLGLLRASGHEHFRGSLVVPILGERGQLVQCYGRKLRDDLREGTPLHLYLPGPHAAVWNVDALAASKEIILCEALFDAMTFWVAGFTNVITSYGVSGFTEAHRAALRRYGTERVLVAYDADAAGDRAAEQVAEELTRMGIECYRVHFPRGLDANAYALTNAPASESLGALLRGATWLGRGAPVIAAAPVISSLAAAPVAAPAVVASPVPAPPPQLSVERHGDDVVCAIADRSYRVRGLAKNQSPDALRVNLLAKRGEEVHVDTLDLYVARVRTLFIGQAAKELGVSEETIKRDVGAVILALESLVAEQTAATLTPALSAGHASTMSDPEREAALALLSDLDAERGTLLVREGKGKKDRLVPIGERAIRWTHLYLDRVRRLLLCRAHDLPSRHALFLSSRGVRIRATKLTARLHQYLVCAGIEKPGSVHIFRHTMATLMHDAGADIRDLQEMLGHAQLSTTEIYTHVSIERLKAVHTKTHPAHLEHARAPAPFLLAAEEER